MSRQKHNPDLFKRLLFGIVGSVALVSLIRDLNAGFFNNHGEAIQRIDHPVEFWFWIAFTGVLGIAGLYIAIFGDRNGTD